MTQRLVDSAWSAELTDALRADTSALRIICPLHQGRRTGPHQRNRAYNLQRHLQRPRATRIRAQPTASSQRWRGPRRGKRGWRNR